MRRSTLRSMSVTTNFTKDSGKFFTNCYINVRLKIIFHTFKVRKNFEIYTVEYTVSTIYIYTITSKLQSFLRYIALFVVFDPQIQSV